MPGTPTTVARSNLFGELLNRVPRYSPPKTKRRTPYRRILPLLPIIRSVSKKRSPLGGSRKSRKARSKRR